MKYHIININLTAITTDEPESDVPCGSCVTCCERLAPHLSPEEVASGLYPISLVQPSPEQIANNPDVGVIVTLHKLKDGGCGMLINGRCSIYNHRPKACRQFDCRKGHHPKIPDMTVINNANS